MKRRKILTAAIVLFILVGLAPIVMKWMLYQSCLKRVDALSTRLVDQGTLPRELRPAREDLEGLVSFLSYVLPRYNSSWRAWLFRSARGLLSDAEKDLRALEAGADPFLNKRGILLKVFHSDIDGGLEPYFLDVPYSYDSERAWPLVIQLHGFVGLGPPFQQAIPAHREDCLTLAPHGKGSIDFKWVAEQDVLHALREVQQQYHVDANRIYLQGHSMGGTGSWSIGAHYPDRFAAIAVSAGNTDDKVWEKLWEVPEAPPGSKLLLFRRVLEDADSAINFAPNFVNLPAYVVHGGLDDTVPVEHSRRMVEALKKLSGPVQYREIPLATHASELLTPVSRQFEWLLQHKRNPRPAHFRITAHRLRYARAYNVEIREFANLMEFGEVDVTASPDSTGNAAVAMKTRNVSEIAVAPFPGEKRIGSIRIDGATVQPGNLEGATKQVLLRREGRGWQAVTEITGPHKRAGLEGPIEDAMMSRFIVVVGTQGKNEVENRVLKQEAQALQDQWVMRFGYPCFLKTDMEITAEDIRTSNLFCYGRPDQNLIVRRAAARLPVVFREHGFVFGGRTYAGENQGLQFCIPNPLNEEHYLVVFVSNSWRGMFQMNNRFGNWFDWSAYENRKYYDYAVFDDKTHSPETFLVLGYFGPHWNLTPEYRFEGDEKLRARSDTFAVPSVFQVSPGVREIPLSEVVPNKIRQLLGPVQFNRGFTGRRLQIGTRSFERGIGVKAPSSLEFDLNGDFRQFSGKVGIDTEGRKLQPHHLENNRLIFEVFGDGRLLKQSGVVECNEPPILLKCSVQGVERLRISVRQEEHLYRWFLLSAVWAEAKVVR